MLKGLSPIVTYVLITAIVVAAITLVLTFALPLIQKAQEVATYQQALEILKTIDLAVKEVASEGIGALRKVDLRFDKGEFRIEKATDSIIYKLDSKAKILEPGYYSKRGNLEISAGADAIAKEYDFDNDGNEEIVLENSFIKVVLKKIGSETTWQPINTSELLEYFVLKTTNQNLTIFDSKIELDDFSTSSYGNGYSKALKPNVYSSQAKALVHVNSSLIEYDILYTLPAYADYLIVEIQNAHYK